LEQKISQQASLEDMIQKVSHAHCEDPQFFVNVQSVYKKLVDMSIDDYKQYYEVIISAEQDLYSQFQQTCM